MCNLFLDLMWLKLVYKVCKIIDGFRYKIKNIKYD